MIDYEQLGIFYMGKEYDLDKQKCKDELVLYESRDLVTHAVCVGMTGSGKTGLCVDLLEEAAIDRIPIIAIDPKGDLSNLLLTFEGLDPQAFLPWVDPDEAQRAQIAPQEWARRESEKWRKGLAEWHQDVSRIKLLKESAEFTVYTPASSAGISLSVLKSFNCPGEAIMEERDLAREQISSTATSILALLGIASDPLKSKEHILLSSIIDHCWKSGQDLDLESLIEKIQNPPVKQLGALPLETFFPKKERHALAMTVNNLLASPGFEAWLEGEPLDVDRLLYSESGKNKVSIISIAHLPDAERMFFVTLLLTQILSWMRRQSGTSSLRAIIYMDEILGFFPPVANPPSKAPLITLLKQARAFGLGLVLATQNPVDLDYKALGNTGTWFIGRLQTERDKMRVLDGLETAASDSGSSFNRAKIDKLISSLSRQVFLMNNVHRAEPTIMKTRWSLSYLRGPLSRAQLKSLKAKTSQSAQANDTGANGSAAANNGVAAHRKNRVTLQESSPVLESGAEAEKQAQSKQAKQTQSKPDIAQRFASIGRALPEGAKLVYKPMIFASAILRFSDSKSQLEHTEEVNLLTLIKSEIVPVKWEKAFSTKFGANQLKQTADPAIELAALPPEAADPDSFKQWSSDLCTWLASNRQLELFRCPSSHVYSRPHETERDFRIRLQQAQREQRDRALSDLSQNYRDKLQPLEERLQRAQLKLESELSQVRSLELESAINVSASLLQAFVGRKVLSNANIKRAESAANKINKVNRKQQNVAEAQDTIDMLQDKISQVQADFDAELNSLSARLNPQSQKLDHVCIPLKKNNISLNFFCLCWAPCIRQSDGKITAAW